jgi:pilus assembly protein CpaB
MRKAEAAKIEAEAARREAKASKRKVVKAKVAQREPEIRAYTEPPKSDPSAYQVPVASETPQGFEWHDATSQFKGAEIEEIPVTATVAPPDLDSENIPKGNQKKTKKEKNNRREKPKKAKQSRRRKENDDKQRRTFGEIAKSRVFIGILCLVFPMLICFVGAPMVQEMLSERVVVLKASADIQKGTLITSDMIEESDVAAMDKPKNAALVKSEIVDTYAKYDILNGDVFTDNRLTKEIPFENPYLYELSDGKLAVSVTVADLAEGLTSKLKSGDVVTVYAAMTESGDELKENYTAIQPEELRYVKLLAVSNSSGGDIDPDAPFDPEADEATRIISTVTLECDPIQSASLAGLNANAKLHFALASRGDNTELSASLLKTQDEVLEKLTVESKINEYGKIEQEIPTTEFADSFDETEVSENA